MCIVYHRPPLCSTTSAGALKFYGFPQRFSGANLLFILRSRWGWIQRSLRKKIAQGRCIPRYAGSWHAMDADTFIEKGSIGFNGYAISAIGWYDYVSETGKSSCWKIHVHRFFFDQPCLAGTISVVQLQSVQSSAII